LFYTYRFTYALFPALIYCFSNIDLALYAERADVAAATTQQSKKYIMDFMGIMKSKVLLE
jgi:hypothetical protein